jgi:hypothetical protein
MHRIGEPDGLPQGSITNAIGPATLTPLPLSRRPASTEHRRPVSELYAKVSSHACRLEPHVSMLVHPVIHVAPLRPDTDAPFPSYTQMFLPAPVDWNLRSPCWYTLSFTSTTRDPHTVQRQLDPVFHVALLKAAARNPVPVQSQSPPPDSRMYRHARFHGRYPHKPGPLGFAGAQR